MRGQLEDGLLLDGNGCSGDTIVLEIRLLERWLANCRAAREKVTGAGIAAGLRCTSMTRKLSETLGMTATDAEELA
jgi:hypothetical protein